MTSTATPRDDIGLSERLRNRTSLQAFVQLTFRHSYDYEAGRALLDEAANQLDAQAAELASLRADNDKMHDLVDQLTQAHHDAEAKCDAQAARVKELEEERDEALERVDELERDAGVVSDEFEKDCWKAMRSLLTECKFDWRNVEPDGVTADDAREYIHETLNNLESSWQREHARATRAEQERDDAYERLKALIDADALAGVRKLVAGWNGEDRPEGPFNERHPDRLGATLPKTNCGAVYQLDDAMTAARDCIRRLAAGNEEGK